MRDNSPEPLKVYVGRVLLVSEWMAGEWGGKPESYRLAARDLLSKLGEVVPEESVDAGR